MLTCTDAMRAYQWNPAHHTTAAQAHHITPPHTRLPTHQRSRCHFHHCFVPPSGPPTTVDVGIQCRQPAEITHMRPTPVSCLSLVLHSSGSDPPVHSKASHQCEIPGNPEGQDCRTSHLGGHQRPAGGGRHVSSYPITLPFCLPGRLWYGHASAWLPAPCAHLMHGHWVP